jgi:excisionase family DNA binding protein
MAVDVYFRPEVMNAEEACIFLRISKWALYDAATRGEVPHQRIGRRLVFSRQALLQWLGCNASPRHAGSDEVGHVGIPR